MPHKAKPEHWNDLKHVTTVAQACRDYPISRSGLSYAIDANNVVAVRMGRVILVSTRSLETYIYRRKTT